MSAADVDRVAVVVPATDEQLLIGPALRAIGRAARQVSVDVEVVVVANGCLDATAAVAAEHGAHVVELPDPSVGAARAAGCAWALRRGPAGLWIAGTDADSLVPREWLTGQLEAAATGADLVLGTIELRPVDRRRHRAWVERYRRQRLHVHGANLGVRATAYVSAGGFAPLRAHEDGDLVERLLASGARAVWCDDLPVVTSARTDPRAPAGVGHDLAVGEQPA